MMQQKERLEKQLDFIREIDKEKEIFRQTYLADASRKENDAEHAWHMAIMTMLLSEYANEKIDVLKTVGMLLIHDIVEIDAGDTYAYDEAGKATQHEREQKAAEPLLKLWEEFEAQQTPEARFARTMDNIQPMLLNDASGGLSWREHSVKLSQILGRNKRTALGSEKIWDYAFNNILKKHVESGNIIDDEGVFSAEAGACAKASERNGR